MSSSDLCPQGRNAHKGATTISHYHANHQSVKSLIFLLKQQLTKKIVYWIINMI